MKLIVKPKCKTCGNWRIEVHCSAVYEGCCDDYFCMLCWWDHTIMQDEKRRIEDANQEAAESDSARNREV